EKNESLRMTVLPPIVSRSVQTGTCGDKITTFRPIFAPNARRYNTYIGEPANRTTGLNRTSVLTSQKRKYPRLQKRICWGCQRPMRVHFARIGRMHMPRNPAPVARIARQKTSTKPEPAAIHL